MKSGGVVSSQGAVDRAVLARRSVLSEKTCLDVGGGGCQWRGMEIWVFASACVGSNALKM